MVTIVKHEWHSHDRQYAVELDEALLAEIYPDMENDEIDTLLKEIEEGNVSVEEVINDAWENNIEIEWDFQYDDCWSDRKGGYEVTYELGDEDSWHTEPEEAPPTHKCTKCRWEGKSWETRTGYVDEQGNVLPDDADEFFDTKDVCPMCDSDIELTESGKQEEVDRAKRMAEIDAMFEDEDDDEEEPVDEEELARALEELKQEFDALLAHTHRCTECEWTGTEKDIEKEGICPNCCAYVEKFNE